MAAQRRKATSRALAVQPQVIELSSLPTPIVQELPDTIHDGYQWFDPDNRAKFFENYKGYSDAIELDISQQIELYQQELLTLFFHDYASAVSALFPIEPSVLRVIHHDFKDGYEDNYFYIDVYDSSLRYGRVSLNFHRLERYPRKIPPLALRTLKQLKELGITPRAFYVADIQKDPILYARFYNWLVALTQWE